MSELTFLQIPLPTTASLWTRAEAIAAFLRREKILLILDGLEPLQELSGEIRDIPLRALLQELRTWQKGMMVCTTRIQIRELPHDDRTCLIDLESLNRVNGG